MDILVFIGFYTSPGGAGFLPWTVLSASDRVGVELVLHFLPKIWSLLSVFLHHFSKHRRQKLSRFFGREKNNIRSEHKSRIESPGKWCEFGREWWTVPFGALAPKNLGFIMSGAISTRFRADKHMKEKYGSKESFPFIQEISNRTHWTAPWPWVSNSSSNLLRGPLVRSHSIFDGFMKPRNKNARFHSGSLFAFSIGKTTAFCWQGFANKRCIPPLFCGEKNSRNHFCWKAGLRLMKNSFNPPVLSG